MKEDEFKLLFNNYFKRNISRVNYSMNKKNIINENKEIQYKKEDNKMKINISSKDNNFKNLFYLNNKLEQISL